MPSQPISRSFKDINLSFKRHPVTNDIIPISNENAIKRSVQNLVFTSLGERFFNPNLGNDTYTSLFEPNVEDLRVNIREQIYNTIENFEPRVILRNVDVFALPDSNSLEIAIAYDIVGLSFPTQEFNFILQSTRE